MFLKLAITYMKRMTEILQTNMILLPLAPIDQQNKLTISNQISIIFELQLNTQFQRYSEAMFITILVSILSKSPYEVIPIAQSVPQ